MARLSLEQLKATLDELARLDPARRESRLSQLDPHDRQDIESLLRTTDCSTHLPDQGIKSDQLSDRVGPYRVVSKLGEDAMGVTYKAEQDEPFRRTVAAKVIRGGLNGRAAVERFASERDVLTRLVHPSLVGIVDVGLTQSHQVYMATEFIDGVCITQFVKDNKLSPREIIQLMIDVCRGVQHAHEKGVIHRDIKPSCILVRRESSGLVPKVADFGLARLVMSRDRSVSVPQFFGTVQYMSPEQAANDEAAGVRSDVYALGAVMYELLAGQPPFDPAQLAEFPIDEARQVVFNNVPPRARQVRGSIAVEVDAIIAKAMRKDSQARYATVSEFIDDLRAYLEHKPLRAMSGSPVYQAAKFVRRHPLLTLMGVVAVGGLVASSSMSWLSLSRLRAERDVALRQLTDTRVGLVQSQAMLRLLTDVLVPPDGMPGAPNAKLEDLLTRAQMMIEDHARLPQYLRAWLTLVVGRAWESAAKPVLARRYLESAYDQSTGQSSDLRYEVAMALGRSRMRADKPDEAQRLFEEARSLVSPDDGDRQFESSMGIADALRAQGKLEAAQALFERLLSEQENVRGRQSRQVAQVMSHLALVWHQQSRGAEALALASESAEIMSKVAGIDDPQTLIAKANIGRLLLESKRYEQAITVLAGVLSSRTEALGQAHPQTLEAMHLLTRAILATGNDTDAEPMLNQLLTIGQSAYGEDLPFKIWTLDALAQLQRRQGQLPAAIATYDRLLASARTSLAASPEDWLMYSARRADILTAQGRIDESVAILRDTYDRTQSLVGVADPASREIATMMLTALDAKKAPESQLAPWKERAQGRAPATQPTNLPATTSASST